MDMNRSGEIQCQWIPGTPFKPVATRQRPKIDADEQENQLIDAIWLDSEQESRVVAQKTGNEDHNVATSSEAIVDPMDKFKSFKFTDLLAFQHRKGDLSVLEEATREVQGTNDCAAECSGSHSSFSKNGVQSTSPNLLLEFEMFLGSKGPEKPPNGLPFPHWHSNNLNLLPEALADTVSSKTVLEFAPLTPDKVKRAEHGHVTDAQNENVHEGTTLERNEQENYAVQQEKGVQPTEESSVSPLATPFEENHNSDSGVITDTQTNKTPQQKSRKKRHRPKVVKESKPKTTPTPATPKPKRSYVRRNGPKKPTTAPAETPERTKRSFRRALNFDVEGQPQDEGSTCKSAFNLSSEAQAEDLFARGIQSELTARGVQGNVTVEKTKVGFAYDLTCYTNQILKQYISLPEKDAPGTPPSINTNTEQSCQVTSLDKPDCATQSTSTQSASISTSSITAIPTKPEEARGSKRNCPYLTKQTHISNTNLIGVHYNTLRAYDMAPSVQFPNTYKKNGMEEQYSTTSFTSSSMTASKSIIPVIPSPQQDAQADKYEVILAYSQPENLTRKRSRGLTQVRDLASLTRIAGCGRPKQMAGDNDMQRVDNSHQTRKFNEALAKNMHDTLARRKCSNKSNSFVASASSSTNEVNVHQQIDISSNHRHQTYGMMFGTIPSVDEIVEQIKCLDINKEENAFIPHHCRNKEHNSLVLYRREGAIVSSEDSVKKRRPRAKVHLDDESSRVWKLLLENINSEGIDGTDEEKQKWWEEERRVFCGRADSFIARMHLVQGDRRFSQWKGSVVDSVVGVFLTQNVSDHLSSSAFMSLAAYFSLKSKNNKPTSEEGLSLLVREPEVSIMKQEDTIKWNGKISNQPVCNQSSKTPHKKEYRKEKGVIIGTESIGISFDGISSTNELKCKLLNSAESGLENYRESSQNSVECSNAQIAERIRSCSGNNSEAVSQTNELKANSWYSSMSFTKHLEMAGSSMLHGPCIRRRGNQVPGENSVDAHNPTKTVDYDKQKQNLNNLDGPGKFLASSMITPGSYHLHLTPNSGAQEVQCLELLRGATRSSDKYENGTGEPSILTADSTSQSTVQNTLTVGTQEASNCSGENNELINGLEGGKNLIAQTKNRVDGDPKIVSETLSQGPNIKMQKNLDSHILSGETLDLTETISVSDSLENPKHKTVGVDLYENGSSSEESKSNENALKSKSRKAGKENKRESGWDFLRKQAEANGRKRERAADTVDSIDWEAVRCADVNEIANTIKERGMNNVLAGRIKDFLNRLVSEHESIDLEWLRDVPPDKAKEYLLSIKGLGLKSVECVRLLTLHHLAFPVDTNVGRIAVRLGWVPLQPLPESLQLHLLELYPVLESIQKYLWPRLCKLDQRTLYELHYQMITFGKVFCTKSKPNCNACPMRGECKHFASAFASARLALPGPEERRSIVRKIEDSTANQNPVVYNVILSLSPPQATDQSEENQISLQSDAKSGVSKCEPIIEEPATPELESANVPEIDIEDTFYEDPDEIPIIKLNMEEFTNNLQNYMMEIQEGDVSKALVTLTPEITSIPMPKLKRVNQLRTEHLVYELRDSHPLLIGLDRREPDDPCSYLLAIWGPGETAESIEPPEGCCSSSPKDTQTVRGTLLIPCRTAMKGSFPLNGTYFQVNEVFADHETSLNPIEVPRNWLWTLPRRTVYFGTSIPAIFKGLSTEDIQKCFWRGYVCVRGFDRRTRAPRPLIARLHFPASKLSRTKAKPKTSEKIV